MLLELKNIAKYFPLKKGIMNKVYDYVRAVDQVDLSITAGENLGLVGESGSGKTTLGRIILKLYPVDSGRIILEGDDITRLSSSRMRPLRSKVQMVFQDPFSSLDPRLTIRNILKEAFRIQSRRGDRRQERDEQEKSMAQMLTTVGLDAESLNRFPHEFSGGERQRIAIARALIMNPRLLILDEAVSSLDVLIQEQILDLLKELQARFQVTYLFISHNLRVVRKVCDRIAVMYQGKIVELGPTQEIFQNPLHPYTQGLLAAAVDYKSSDVKIDLEIFKNSRLIDNGNGHFVLN